jgi:hypothetical protein
VNEEERNSIDQGVKLVQTYVEIFDTPCLDKANLHFVPVREKMYRSHA